MSFSGRPSRCSPRRDSPRRWTSTGKTRRPPPLRPGSGLSGRAQGQDLLDQFLLARRVIEAGPAASRWRSAAGPSAGSLRGDHNWDWHKDLFPEARGTLPLFDLGLSALIGDLEDRGLLDETVVVVWGEFGRTPRINRMPAATTGRGGGAPWPAGAALRPGRRLDDRLGEEPRTRPVHFREVFATLYQRLGIDAERTWLTDLTGGRNTSSATTARAGADRAPRRPSPSCPTRRSWLKRWFWLLVHRGLPDQRFFFFFFF